MSSKGLSMLLINKSNKGLSWRRLLDPSGMNSPRRVNNASNHYVQQEQAYFTSHLRNVESHLQAEVANRTTEVEARAAALENAYAQMHRELLEQRHQLQEHQAHLLEGGFQLQGEYNEHVSQLRRDLQEAQQQSVLDSESGTASGQITQGERAIHQRNLAEQAERWGAHSLEIYDEGRAAISAERQEVLAEREIVNQTPRTSC